MDERTRGALYLLPAGLLLGAIVLGPMLYGAGLSLFQADLRHGLGRAAFVGLDNYLRLLHDPRAFAALGTTSLLAAGSILAEVLLGLGMALLLSKSFRGSSLARTLMLVPWATPTVIVGLIWSWMANDRQGLFNGVLLAFGGKGVPWLAYPGLARLLIVVSDVWKTTPFLALLFWAGLQMISPDVTEAARLDGAGALRRFLHITLPLLWPVMVVALLFRTLDALRIFDLIYVLTGGGPGNATEVLSLYAYKVYFDQMDLGYGAAVSVGIFLCAAGIAVFYVRALGAGRERHEA